MIRKIEVNINTVSGANKIKLAYDIQRILIDYGIPIDIMADTPKYGQLSFEETGKFSCRYTWVGEYRWQ